MMSSMIQDVFTDSCDGDEMSYFRTNSRPLVPGEEHRRSSSLVRSGSSHHSHKLPKHISSMTRSFNSHHVDTVQKLTTPCGTPRKSNLNKTQFNVTEEGCMEDSYENFNAPLGFEPEGRVDIPTVFTEGSPPSYAKWAESIDNLLSDINGINLFQTFLDESGKYLLQFYFACKGFKSSEDKLKLKKDKIFKFAKHIYQKFIKSGKVQLTRHTEQQLMESLAMNSNDPTVYDSAVEEVKNRMQCNLYPLFLKSDVYFQYLQKALESPNSSSNNSGSSNGRQPSCQENGEMQTSNSLRKVADRTLSCSQMSSSSIKSHDDFKKNSNDQVILKEHKEPTHSLTMLASLQERLPVELQPETQLHAEEYHSFIHKPQQDKHLSKSMHDNRLAQKYPDQFYEKLNQKLKQLKQMQDEGNFNFRHDAMLELPPLHNYKSLQSSLSSESLESLRGCLATSGIDTDADGPQSILDHHLSQTFDEVYAPNSIGYLNESHTRPALDRLANSGDESSYNKLRKYLERGFSSQENCSMASVDFDMHNTRSNPALNSRIRSSQCDFNSFNPLHYSQQRLQSDLAQRSMHLRQMNPLGAVFSNIPKSRCYERQYVSQSDSETMDCRVTYPTGYHWQHDFGPINSRRQSMSKETCCCSQPNLHDPARRRTMQAMNKTMVQPSLHQTYHMHPSQQQTTRGVGNHDFRSTEARRTSSSSMPPPATLPPLRSQNSLILTSNTDMISTRVNQYQGLQSKEYHIEARPSQSSISDIRSLSCGGTVVSYFFCDEPIPYRTTLNGVNITLAQFKTYLAKKGNYRYYCMKACDDFDSGIVFEEVFNDTDILPLCGGKICAKIEKQS